MFSSRKHSVVFLPACAVCLALLSAQTLRAADPTSAPPKKKDGLADRFHKAAVGPNADKLVPVDPRDRQKVFETFVEERDKTIQYLLLIVQDGSDPDRPLSRPSAGEGDRFWYAVKMLGKLRAEEAVDPLLDIVNLTFTQSVHHLEFKQPIIDALVAIGKPASKKAVERIASEKSEIRRAYFCEVVRRVEGRELGKEMVRLAYGKEKDPARQARLKAALESFDAKKEEPKK